jgi:MurE/MurF fusion protein
MLQAPAITHSSAAAAAQWLRARVSQVNPAGDLRTDSRRIQAGDAFVAWPGYATDGRVFVQAALTAGAGAVLVEAQGAEAFAFADERISAVQGLKANCGAIADAWYGQPSQQLSTLAVTGTNGKTSTAWWLAQALTALGQRCGVVGTLGVGAPSAKSVQSTGLTTPDPITLHRSLRSMVDAGFTACALEASSIGLVEHRLDALRITVALFSNLTQDHLDYHRSMAAYWAAKRSLFDWPGLQAAVVNVDDAHGAELAQELVKAKGLKELDVWPVSTKKPARLFASGLHYANGALAFTVHEGPQQLSVRCQVVGDYNASNLMLVLSGLRALGVSLQDAVNTLAALTPVPGRLQRVANSGELAVFVDYAHTPDALEKVLQALRPLAAERSGQLWCVFGCGGDRDTSKRPLMGAVAARASDHVVLTSDNPRSEDPSHIMAQVAAGFGASQDHIHHIADRADAIRYAVHHAQLHDVIVLAGKGHENTQEIAGEFLPFSDAAQAQAAWLERTAFGGTALGHKPC